MDMPFDVDVSQQIRFRSDMSVDLVRHMAQDHYVVDAARVSTLGEVTEARRLLEQNDDPKLIDWLMRKRHGSPFEHNAFTFFVSAPLFVFREFQRHRIASYNEESGRYKELAPVFYVPGRERKLVQVGKPGAYRFEAGTDEQHDLVVREKIMVAKTAFGSYKRQLGAGIAREVARGVLPLDLYSSMYVTMNARSLMNFLSLRVDDPQATYESKPQREIEMVAEVLERAFAEQMPQTHFAFHAHGRVSP